MVGPDNILGILYQSPLNPFKFVKGRLFYFFVQRERCVIILDRVGINMLFNLIHRPGINAAQWSAFKWQQDIAHELGLKITLLLTYNTLFDKAKIEEFRKYHEDFGDEIGMYLGDMNCPQFFEVILNNEPCFWLYSDSNKKKIVRLLFEKFHEVFSSYPSATGSYYLDAESINIIKKEYPQTEVAVAGCFEEGAHMYHGCNNSWNLFAEGGPWWPWVPSRRNAHCPAINDGDDSGIVALPHLNRDMLLAIESRDDFFASHPVNVLRGMAYDDNNVISYFEDFIDQVISQSEYNRGYSYCNIFAGPAWLVEGTCCWEISTSITRKSYYESLRHLVKKKKQGQLEDMYMTEFSNWFRANNKCAVPTINLWRDILFGSNKQAFWYIDSNYRVLVDPNQGGALTDLRPYVGKISRPLGPESDFLANGSYPFIVNAQHRGGFLTHSGKGSIYSCRVKYKNEIVDLCTCRTQANYEDNGSGRCLQLEPVEIEFADLAVQLATQISFLANGIIQIERSILASSCPQESVVLEEYVNGCWGTNEYPEDLRGVKLSIEAKTEKQEIRFKYGCRKCLLIKPEFVKAIVPQLMTDMALIPKNGAESGFIEEGFIFNPFFTLSLSKQVRAGERMITWIKLQRNT